MKKLVIALLLLAMCLPAFAETTPEESYNAELALYREALFTEGYAASETDDTLTEALYAFTLHIAALTAETDSTLPSSDRATLRALHDSFEAQEDSFDAFEDILDASVISGAIPRDIYRVYDDELERLDDLLDALDDRLEIYYDD